MDDNQCGNIARLKKKTNKAQVMCKNHVYKLLNYTLNYEFTQDNEENLNTNHQIQQSHGLEKLNIHNYVMQLYYVEH